MRSYLLCMAGIVLPITRMHPPNDMRIHKKKAFPPMSISTTNDTTRGVISLLTALPIAAMIVLSILNLGAV